MSEDAELTYSISWRLERVTVEYAYVKVEVTPDLIVEQADGTGRIDVDSMIQRAIELGHVSGTVWYPESQQIQPHPIQKAPEPGES